MLKKYAAFIILAVALLGTAIFGWWQWTHPGLPDGIAMANGRLEAEQVQVATKYAGRVESVLVAEGDVVTAGQVVARMDTRDVLAQLEQAQAQLLSAQSAEGEAQSALSAREADRLLAKQELSRVSQLHKKGFASSQLLDKAKANMDAAEAMYEAAQATLRRSIAGIDAAQATIKGVQAVVEDSTLVAPRSGRVQYKLIQSGEVVAAGTPVVTLLDLTDVYMTVFLPAANAGILAIGDEARIIVDPAPQYVIPAKVTFVAEDAQFTPKAVETKDEREKLMFRVKLTIDPALLHLWQSHVKTGVRGVGYVRVKRGTEWPADLAIKLPELTPDMATENAGQ
jgi:HlyD family secretion protein